MSLVLNADTTAKQIEVVQKLAQVRRRIGVITIGPDDDILDVRRLTRLPQVGGASHQNIAAICLDDETLEETETESIVACQPVHALLCKQKNCIQLLFGHHHQQPVAARGKFFRFEMKGHTVTP